MFPHGTEVAYFGSKAGVRPVHHVRAKHAGVSATRDADSDHLDMGVSASVPTVIFFPLLLTNPFVEKRIWRLLDTLFLY